MTTINWNAIYGSGASQNQNIPLSSQSDSTNCVFRDFCINWSDLQNQPGVGSLPLWQIFCDTLEIDNDISVNGGLVIFARRIVAPNGTTIALNRTAGGYTPLTIVAQETVDSNNNPSTLVIETIQGVSTIESVKFTASGVEAGLTWSMTDTTAQPCPVSSIGGSYLSYGQPLQLSLMSLFSLATVIFTTNMQVALRQLQWVCNLGNGYADTQTLAAQANTFASTLAAMNGLKEGTILVPALDEDIYSLKAQACLAFLQDQQNAYTALQQQEANLQQWVANAQTMMQVGTVEQTLYTNLQQQAQTTYNQTTYARTLAGQQIVSDNNNLVALQIAFNRGVKDWESAQETQDALNIVSGVVQILAQIPAIIAAGPEIEVLPAVQSAASLLSAANGALAGMFAATPGASTSSGSTEEGSDSDDESDTGSDAGSDSGYDADDESGGSSASSGGVTPSSASSTASSSTSSSTSPSSTTPAPTTDNALAVKRQMTQNSLMAAAQNVGSGAKSIVQSAMNIYDTTRTAQMLESQSQNALSLANSTVNNTFSSLSLSGINVVTGGAQNWQNLEVDINTIFNVINGYNISGAAAYQAGLQKLIISGKAYCQTQLAVAKAASKLAEAKMRQSAAAQKEAIFNQRYKSLSASIVQDNAIGQLLYARVLDAKRAVYLALNDYLRAVEYFTLQPASALPPMPAMTADVNSFSSAVSAIAGNELALSALSPPPQTIGSLGTPGITITLNDPGLIQQVASSGMGAWTISTSNPIFTNFYRIRLNLVRVYLMGVTAPGNIEVQIVTSGAYQDINPLGAPNQFVGPPLRVNFVYTGNPSSPTVVYDGQVPSIYANDFFHPTPFTSWAIKVSTQSGASVDLSQLTAIQLQLGGEATPS